MRPFVLLATTFVVFSFVGCATSGVTGGVPPGTFEDVEAALARYDAEEARAILRHLVAAGGDESATRREARADGEDRNAPRAEVLQRSLTTLAWIDWKFYRDRDAALGHVDAALRLGTTAVGAPSDGAAPTGAVPEVEARVLRARIERESGKPARAVRRAEEAMEAAARQPVQGEARREAVLEYARAVYAFGSDRIGAGRALPAQRLADARSRIAHLVETSPADTEAAHLLLGLSLLSGDGPAALAAWRAYYGVTESIDPSAYLHPAADTLERYLQDWTDSAPLSTETLIAIAGALAESRFYEYSRLMVMRSPAAARDQVRADPGVADIVAYTDYLDVLAGETEELYRGMATGRAGGPEVRQYKRRLRAEQDDLFNRLNCLADSRGEYSDRRFAEAMERHFGALGFTGRTNSYAGYNNLLGHIVHEESRRIEQYGYEAEITFRRIDHLATTGFPGWFREQPDVGGWSKGDRIIEVRAAYAAEPAAAWRFATNPDEREQAIAAMEGLLAAEAAAQVRQGVAVRLRADAIDDLYDRLVADGLRGRELYYAFTTSYSTLKREAAIFAHEGRHSIEQIHMSREFSRWSGEVRELHAKLSEIAFAPEPRLPLANMVGGVNDSDHGRANRRIVEIAEEYIRANGDSIEGYDPARPAILYLPELSADQIRRCFTEADPLARSVHESAPAEVSLAEVSSAAVSSAAVSSATP